VTADKMIDNDIAVQVQHTGHQQQYRDLMFTLQLNSLMASHWRPLWWWAMSLSSANSIIWLFRIYLL